jgi:hypothetical protein
MAAAVGHSRRGEENVKARDNRRPGRRRTPEEIVREHEEALRSRARLRAEASGLAAEAPAPPALASKLRARSERSRFAAAIARAEFGRFYFKEMKSSRPRKPSRGLNGKTD